MSNAINDFLESYRLLSLKEIGLMLTCAKIKHAKASDHLISKGELTRKIYIVTKGMLRTYIVKEDGTEVTQLFATEKMAAGAYKPFFLNHPSSEYLQAVEDSLLIEFDMGKVEELAQKNLGIALLQTKVTKETLVEAIERITFYTGMSPEERFIHIRDTRPELIQRAPQKYLASYLGVTPQSYSRMKARIMERA